MRHTSRVTVAVAVVGTVALLAGCGSSKSDASRKPGKPSDSPAATAATPTPGGSGAGATGAGASSGAAGGPTGSPTPTAVAQGTCPVTAATLMAALRANAKLHSALASPNEVKNPHCASGYAVATTVPIVQVEPALVVYAFDAKVGTWRAVNGGTDGVCEGTVPAAIAKQLPGC